MRGGSEREMGIPVVPVDENLRWHVDIGQKVPLNIERDNLTPSYLRIGAGTLNLRTKTSWSANRTRWIRRVWPSCPPCVTNWGGHTRSEAYPDTTRALLSELKSSQAGLDERPDTNQGE